MKEKDRFGKARMEGIFNALAEGKSSFDELNEAARTSESTAIENMGKDSEGRFLRYSRRVRFIKGVREASVYDDAYEAIDAWIEFKDCENLPALPVQIKSSLKDVKEFKRNGKFKALNEMQIVINCGPSVSFGSYMYQLRREIRRIKSLINT